MQTLRSLLFKWKIFLIFRGNKSLIRELISFSEDDRVFLLMTMKSSREKNIHLRFYRAKISLEKMKEKQEEERKINEKALSVTGQIIAYFCSKGHPIERLQSDFPIIYSQMKEIMKKSS